MTNADGELLPRAANNGARVGLIACQKRDYGNTDPAGDCSMRRIVFGIILICGSVLLLPVPSQAQGTSSGAVAGTVKDASGAVLPGVTVEASSPALIEKTRTTVTDDKGDYKIIELRPGTYTVAFTLTGFNTFKRDGLQLAPNFT